MKGRDGVNKVLASLRGVLRKAWRLGLVDAETYRRAVDLPTVRGERLPQGRGLSRRELQKLFVACATDRTPVGRRDAALIAVLYGGGLRRSEIVGLDLDDCNAETTELRVRANTDTLGRRDGGEMFQMVNGVATDAHLHAEMLGDDDEDCYYLTDLPTGRPITDADIERARELYRQRMRERRS